MEAELLRIKTETSKKNEKIHYDITKSYYIINVTNFNVQLSPLSGSKLSVTGPNYLHKER